MHILIQVSSGQFLTIAYKEFTCKLLKISTGTQIHKKIIWLNICSNEHQVLLCIPNHYFSLRLILASHKISAWMKC